MTRLRTIAIAGMGTLAVATHPAAATDHTAEDWLACEATAVVFKDVLGRWEAEGRGSAEPALSNVEALRVGLALAAVYVAVGTDVAPGDPRLDGLRDKVVAARTAAADKVERELAADGLDATFTAVSQALSVCQDALQGLEDSLREETGGPAR